MIEQSINTYAAQALSIQKELGAKEGLAAYESHTPTTQTVTYRTKVWSPEGDDVYVDKEAQIPTLSAKPVHLRTQSAIDAWNKNSYNAYSKAIDKEMANIVTEESLNANAFDWTVAEMNDIIEDRFDVVYGTLPEKERELKMQVWNQNKEDALTSYGYNKNKREIAIFSSKALEEIQTESLSHKIKITSWDNYQVHKLKLIEHQADIKLKIASGSFSVEQTAILRENLARVGAAIGGLDLQVSLGLKDLTGTGDASIADETHAQEMLRNVLTSIANQTEIKDQTFFNDDGIEITVPFSQLNNIDFVNEPHLTLEIQDMLKSYSAEAGVRIVAEQDRINNVVVANSIVHDLGGEGDLGLLGHTQMDFLYAAAAEDASKESGVRLTAADVRGV